MEEDLIIRPGIVIPGAELAFTASRASGPGGQYVNKTNSRVTLEWNVRETAALNEEQREKVLRRLANRVNRNGTIKVHVATERSQLSNRRIARERLARLIASALRAQKKRVATAIPESQKERRLSEKKRRGAEKRLRSQPEDD